MRGKVNGWSSKKVKIRPLTDESGDQESVLIDMA